MKHYKSKLFSLYIIFLTLTSLSFAHGPALALDSPQIVSTQEIQSTATHMGRVENINLATTAIENLDFSAKYVVRTQGYRKATVSLTGQAKTSEFSRCRVGVIFMPYEKMVLSAWVKDKELLLAEEVTASVSPEQKYFQGQIEIDIKFPNYLLGFYNTCETEVNVNLYTYLK